MQRCDTQQYRERNNGYRYQPEYLAVKSDLAKERPALCDIDNEVVGRSGYPADYKRIVGSEQ